VLVDQPLADGQRRVIIIPVDDHGARRPAATRPRALPPRRVQRPAIIKIVVMIIIIVIVIVIIIIIITIIIIIVIGMGKDEDNQSEDKRGTRWVRGRRH
jgi:flagellar biosynthesis/type III secretory pathway M-ring protein FliF/YscJ